MTPDQPKRESDVDTPEDLPAPPEINADPSITAGGENINGLDEAVDKAAAEVAWGADDAPDENPDIDEIIEAAVGVSMEAFTRRHPTTARYLIRRLGDPLEFTIKALKEDELYQQLIANTEEALDIANIIRVIVSVALSVAERLLIAL